MPKRIQRQRTKGWRKPEGVINVTRQSKWGNPFKVGIETILPATYAPVKQRGVYVSVSPEDAVQLFRAYALKRLQVDPDWLEPLRGKDLMCWCRHYMPCHADVLLELANAEVQHA